jgi:exosortase
MLANRDNQQREVSKPAAKRNTYFVCATLLAMGLCGATLKSLAVFCWHSDLYSFSAAVPFISAVLVYLERKRIFAHVQYDLAVGSVIAVLALGMRLASATHPSLALSLPVLSFIFLWVGIFVACFGTKALQAAAFQLSLLLFIVPLPAVLLDKAIFILRSCSTEAAVLIFRLGGIPFFQNEFRFSLPGVDIEVAEQCSGIRSGLSFFVTSLLVGHLFLRSSWSKLALVIAAFPITVFKNGMRIVTIYELSIRPSMVNVVTWVHHNGGILFSLVGLIFLGLAVVGLRKWEETLKPGGRAPREQLADEQTAASPSLKLTCQ